MSSKEGPAAQAVVTTLSDDLYPVTKKRDGEAIISTVCTGYRGW